MRTRHLHVLAPIVGCAAFAGCYVGYYLGTVSEPVGPGGTGGSTASSSGVTVGSGGAGGGSTASSSGGADAGDGGDAADGGPGSLAWAKNFGDPTAQTGQGMAGNGIAVDGAGDAIVTGYAFGSVDFGCGSLTSKGNGGDIFVAKLSGLDGTCKWAKLFGNASLTQAGYGVAVDSSKDVFVTGNANGSVDFGCGALVSAGSDVFVAKLSGLDGTCKWAKLFGDSQNQAGVGTAVDAAGNVFVTGWVEGSVDFGCGVLASAATRGAFVAKLAGATGACAWGHVYGTSLKNTGAGVAVDPSGAVVVTGSFEAPIDFGGGALSPSGGESSFVAKLDTNGSQVWSYGFGDNQVQEGLGITADSAGSVLTTGFFCGTLAFGGQSFACASGDDAFVAGFNASGVPAWANAYGKSLATIGAGIASDFARNVAVVGTFSGAIDFGNGPIASAGAGDIWLAKLNPAGGVLWGRTFGDPTNQSGLAVATDGAGAVFITGDMSGAVDFGGTTLDAFGAAPNIVVAKFNP